MAFPTVTVVGIPPKLQQIIGETVSAVYRGALPPVEIVPVIFMEFGMEEKVIEKYKEREQIMSTKPRASLSERFINCIKVGVGQFYPLVNSVGPDVAAGDLQLLDRIYGPPPRAPDLNQDPLEALTAEQMVSFYKKENAQHLFNFAEGCFVRVGMEKEAEDFRKRVKAVAEFQNFESVKLWNYFTLTYKMHREVVAARWIDAPTIAADNLHTPNDIFPIPQSGWKPELKDRASKAVVIKEGCGEKRKAAATDADADADENEAGPSLLKKNKAAL